jgi:hypothetical protein
LIHGLLLFCYSGKKEKEVFIVENSFIYEEYYGL